MKKILKLVSIFAMVVLGSCYEHDTLPIANESITEVVVTDHRGDAREYIVYIPSTYDEDQEHALVFQLHGGSGNGEKFYTISGWNELANNTTLSPSTLLPTSTILKRTAAAMT